MEGEGGETLRHRKPLQDNRVPYTGWWLKMIENNIAWVLGGAAIVLCVVFLFHSIWEASHKRIAG
jgi:hypothetical protein